MISGAKIHISPQFPTLFPKKNFVVLCSIMLTTPFRVRLILSRKAINKEDSANYSYQPYPLENFFASKQNGGAKSQGKRQKMSQFVFFRKNSPLNVFQGQKPFGSKDGLSRHKQFFGRYFVKLFEEFLLGEGKAIVKVTLRHPDGHVLKVIVGDAYLSLELPTGGIKGALRQRMVCQAFQFSKDKLAATASVLSITAIINRPNTCIRVGCMVAFDRINKSVSLAKSEVQATAQSRSA